MPFVKKTHSQVVHPLSNAHMLFIGRTSELLFFVQNILTPEEPTHNILSISGQGGVGKSTLLNRFISECHSANFKDYCLTAIVDERQVTPISMMEKFAEQLHIEGEFKKIVDQYKSALRDMQSKGEVQQGTILSAVPDIAGAMVEGLPFAGPVLREGVKVSSEHLLDKYHRSRLRKDIEQLEHPIDTLTRAFVTELNCLAEAKVTLNSNQAKHERRIILFFDTFEQLAVEAVPWLLDQFLELPVNTNVVLVIAGRDPIGYTSLNNPKRWLQYYDIGTIYSITLNSFTERETRAYLAKRGITNPSSVETIWQLSRGLPLYLSLLTSNPLGKVDPMKDVVDNFLCWIPEQEHAKRQLALDAALFSHPFNQDDLEAFRYLPEQERAALYRWLIEQPFIRAQDGRYSYHELAYELFKRHLYQRSKKEYYASRRALANHYKRLLKEIQTEEHKHVVRSSEWLELICALANQLFFLPDKMGHLKACERIMDAIDHTTMNPEQSRQIVRFLRELSQVQIDNQIPLHAWYITKPLLLYIEVELTRRGQEMLKAVNDLLGIVIQTSSSSSNLLASLYRSRGWAHYNLEKYQEAIDDFNHALQLNTNLSDAYSGRGWAHLRLEEYKQSLEDFDHALTVNPNLSSAYNGRGRIYRRLKQYQQALSEYDCLIKIIPQNELSYLHRGRTYLLLKDIENAAADMARSVSLNPQSVPCGWAVELVRMCQGKPGREIVGRLERLAAINPEEPAAYLCRGVAQWFSHRFANALIELKQGITSRHGGAGYLNADSFFWIGMSYACLECNGEAIAAIEKALSLELPPILISPLHWFKQEIPTFYKQYAEPLLIHYQV